MIACGDGYNDLDHGPACWSWHCYGKWRLPVRKAADYITLTNEEDGVAFMLRREIYASLKSQKFSRSNLP